MYFSLSRQKQESIRVKDWELFVVPRVLVSPKCLYKNEKNLKQPRKSEAHSRTMGYFIVVKCMLFCCMKRIHCPYTHRGEDDSNQQLKNLAFLTTY